MARKMNKKKDNRRWNVYFKEKREDMKKEE